MLIPKAALGLLQAILTVQPFPCPAGSFLTKEMTYPNSTWRETLKWITRKKSSSFFVLTWPREDFRQGWVLRWPQDSLYLGLSRGFHPEAEAGGSALGKEAL